MKPLKRSFTIAGHRTSISLEPPFWDALKDIAVHDGSPLTQLVARIDAARGPTNLSSAVRIHILAHFRQAATAETSLTPSQSSHGRPQLEP